MAAEQKAVESTVEEILQREEHLVVTDHADLSVRVARESHSAKENHSVRDLSVRDQREEASASVVKDVHSAKDRREDHSEKEQKEDHSETESHSERESHSEKDLSVRDRKKEASARVVKEDHQEASVTESQQVQDSIQAARASTERTSTSSVMRSRAESTR